MASRAATLFDGSGKLVDEPTRKRLQAFLKDFAAFVAAQKG